MQSLNPAIQKLIDYFVENKIARKSIRLRDEEGFKKFMEDAKPAVDAKLLIVKRNPIDKMQIFISSGPELGAKMFGENSSKHKRLIESYIRKTVRKYLSEADVKVPSNVKKYIDAANTLIADSKANHWDAIEPDSSWESVYEFNPIEIKNGYVYTSYTEPLDSNPNKVIKERYKFSSMDLIPQLQWILKALKKGLKNKDR